MTTFKNFADMAAAIKEAERKAQQDRDLKAAADLRRSAGIANRKPGTGPRIAKAAR